MLEFLLTSHHTIPTPFLPCRNLLLMSFTVTGKPCIDNGQVTADGAKWEEDCNICQCQHGKIHCTMVT